MLAISPLYSCSQLAISLQFNKGTELVDLASSSNPYSCNVISASHNSHNSHNPIGRAAFS
jgi:hypothetical protein